jgi:hypothetical protein
LVATTGVTPASATLPTMASIAVARTVEGAAMKGPGDSRSNRRILERLSQESVTVALDTEFSAAETLTIQAATRVSKQTIAVKVYRSPRIRGCPQGFQVRDYIAKQRDDPFFTRIQLLPFGLIRAELSPVQLLKDLFGIRRLDSRSREIQEAVELQAAEV